MITASMSISHRAHVASNLPILAIADGLYRYRGFQTNGEPLQIPNERNTEGALVVLQVLRRKDNSEL